MASSMLASTWRLRRGEVVETAQNVVVPLRREGKARHAIVNHSPCSMEAVHPVSVEKVVRPLSCWSRALGQAAAGEEACVNTSRRTCHRIAGSPFMSQATTESTLFAIDSACHAHCTRDPSVPKDLIQERIGILL